MDISSSQNDILSAKVARALEVRTDTPAMKAALEALANLSDHQQDLFSFDSRSVRVAIEQDALQQALVLQNELKSLLGTISQLHTAVSDTASIAHRVSDAIHMNVIDTGDPDGTRSSSSAAAASNTAKPPQPLELKPEVSNEDTLAEEQKLAMTLNEAFVQRNAAQKRLEAVQSFLEKFDLSEADSRLLDHYAFEDVEASNVNGTAFLAALERVRLIRQQLGRSFGSNTLVGHQPEFDTGDRRLGTSSALRMMETLAQKQERAYERLYHWLQNYLRLHSQAPNNNNPNSGVTPDDDLLDEALAHPFVRRSLFTLRNVPAFFSHMMELIASSRRTVETRRFLLALTSGYNGLPPIEMKAHDSVSYVGDMLAFCFRSFSVEADVARSLLNNEFDEEANDKDNSVEQEDSDILAEKPISIAEMLNHSLGGVARPLKSRILQVVANLSRRPDDEDEDDDDDNFGGFEEEGAVTRNRLAQLYEICGLLLFYASAINKNMQKLHQNTGSEGGESLLVSQQSNPLITSIMECIGEATTAYEASLRVYGAMLDQLHVVTGDSEASLVHAMVTRVVNVREASPGFAEDVICPADYQRILSLEWLCETLIEAALPSCKSLDDAVSLKQSIAVATKVTFDDAVASSLDAKVCEKESALIDVLVEKETTHVLDLCGLGSLATAWKDFESVRVDGMLMASHPGLTPDDAEASMKEFYASLYSPPLPSLESAVKDPTLRKVARNKIASNVCKTYEDLYKNMTTPDRGGYDNLSFLGHTPAQVNTLFSA